MSLRTLLADLDLAEAAGTGDEPRDIDTWTDLRDLDAGHLHVSCIDGTLEG